MIKLIVLGEELEVEGNLGFGLNYNIDDVKDPSKRSCNYSKTVKLAGTKKANKLLGGIFDINADFTYFNPNIKSEAKIVVNSVTVIDGFMQLKSIDKDLHSSTDGNNIVYNVNIQSKTVDFYTDIKDKKLSDLDFSDYNHTYNQTNISNSWIHTNKEIYTYPMVVKGSNTYETKDFKPAIFHKSYVKRIAMESGYSVGGSIFDETTAEGAAYAREIIPYNGERVELSKVEQQRRLFQAGLSTTPIVLQSTTTVAGEVVFTNLKEDILFINNDSSGNNFDPNGHYNTTTNTFTSDVNGSFNFRLDGSFTMFWDSNGASKTWGGSISTTQLILKSYINGVAQSVFSNPVIFANPSSLNAGISFQYEDVKVVALYLTGVDMNIGDELTFKYELIGNTVLAPSTFEDVDVSFRVNTAILKNEVNSNVLKDQDELALNEHIPNDIKQIDLITDLIKRYNAYIYPDPNNDKRIIFDTRDTYFASGETLDWTNKKDYSKKDSIKLLSELQNKELKFSYTEDKDEYNEKYSQKVNGEIFGVKTIEFENEFVKGTTPIKTTFAPTPLVGNSNNPIAIVPAIEYNGETTKPRVLYYGGLKDCLNSSEWTFEYIVSGNNTSTQKTQYPYAGHLDDPINPALDLNFGINDFSFYGDLQDRTNGTLYNRFWRNYVEQIDSGKMLTTYFNLNEVDISNVKDAFNTKIFIKNSYYYLNKIIDYNPVNKGVTKVELLKIKDGTAFVVEDIEKNIAYNDFTDFANFSGDQNNNYSKSNGVVFNGQNNYVGSGSDNSTIVGNNNFIADNIPNAFIIGASNKQVSEIGQGWVGESEYFNGSPLKMPSYKVLTLSITQIEALVPTSTQLSDSYNKDYFFQYVSTGFYKFIISDGFTMNTTSVLASLNSENNSNSVITYIDSPEQIFIKTFNSSGVLTNGILHNAFFEFRFYE